MTRSEMLITQKEQMTVQIQQAIETGDTADEAG